MYFIIATLIISTLMILVSIKFEKKQWIIIIMTVITLICVFTNKHEYPDDNASDVLETDLMINHSIKID